MATSPQPELHFETLCEDDLSVIMKIELEAYPEPWTLGMFREEMRSKRSFFRVAWVDSNIIGYCGLWLVLDEAHITSITVEKSLRGLGYGREQLDYLLNICRQRDVQEVTLEVRRTNEVARKLYESYGFAAVGVRKGYYSSTNEDAIIMKLKMAG